MIWLELKGYFKKKKYKQENLGITTFRIHKNLSKDVYVKNKDD